MKWMVLAALFTFSFSFFTSCSDEGYQSRLRELILEDIKFSCDEGEQEQVFRHEDLSVYTVANKQKWCVARLDVNNSKLVVSVTANDTYDVRTDTITLTDINNNATRSITVTQARKTGIFLDKNYFEVPMAGGTVTANLKSNVSYEVQIPDTCDWVTKAEAATGSRGLESSTVSLNVSQNKSYHTRDAIITVINNDEKLTDKLIIHQPFNQVFKADSTNFKVAMEGGDITVNMESNIPYEVSIPDTCKWISSSISGVKTFSEDLETPTVTPIVFHVSENKGYHARSAVITLVNKEAGASVTINVTQPFTSIFKVDKKNFEVSMDGGTVTVNLESNVSYDVKIPDDCDWISRPSSRTRGVTTSAVELKVAANTTYKERKAVVVISNKEAGVSESITITQSFNTVFSVDKTSFDVDMAGGTITVNLQHNISYDVIIPDTCDWITLPAASRSKSRSKTRAEAQATAITLRVKENTTYKDRDAVITIANKEAGKSIKISVHQPFTTVFSVDKNAFDVAMDGGTVTVNLQHNISYDVTIPSDCDWITLPVTSRSKQKAGTRAATQTTAITFRVSENMSYADRDAIITISNKNAGVSIKVSIHQPFAAVFNADNTSFDVATEGGTVTVNMETNISYDVSIPSDCGWITMPTASRGKTRAAKTSAVVLRVSENTSYKDRDAVVTISNKKAGVSVGIYIHQPFTTVFNVDKAEAEVPMEGGSVTATVESNISYNVNIPSDCNWITLSSGSRTRAAKTSVVTLKVAANTTGNDRSATVTIGNSSAGVSKALTITQKFTTNFTIDENDKAFELDELEHVIGVSVNANVPITVQSQNSWLKVGGKVGVGTNYWTQQLIASKYTDKTDEPRTGQVKFSYAEGNQSIMVSVTQNRTLYIKESSVTLTEAGKTQDLTLVNPKSKVVTFTSSNTKVATVSSTGTVKAVANGTAVITVKSGDYSYDTVNVTVEIPSKSR